MIQRSPFLSAGSGKIGDMIATRNRFGFILKAYTPPDQPDTPAQQESYGHFGNICDRWLTLTETQRALWRQYAAAVPMPNTLGQSRCITGKQHYIRSNMPRFWPPGGPFWCDAAPTTFRIACNIFWYDLHCYILAMGRLNFYADGINQDPATVENEDSFILCYSSTPHTTESNYWKGPYQYRNAVYLSIGDQQHFATGQSMDTIWKPAGGEVCHLKFIVSRVDGRLSSPLYFRVITEPTP